MKKVIKLLLVIVVLSKSLSAEERPGYDFVAQKLVNNKIHVEHIKPEPRGLMGTLVRETAFLVPSVILGYITAAVIGTALSDNNNKELGALLGAIFGGPGASVGYYTVAKLLVYYLHENPVAVPTLQEFIKNWTTYKSNAPAELHELFDGLYRNYLRNQGKLVMRESQAREILTKILDICLQKSETMHYKANK